MLEFKKVYHEIEEQVSILRSSHLQTPQIEQRLIDLKEEISQEIEGLAAKIQNDIEQLRRKKEKVIQMNFQIILERVIEMMKTNI